MTELPAEDEPDGDRYLGHHFWVGLLAAVVGWMQWTPAGTPVAGTTLVWIGMAVAADDIISHTFGVTTPLDALFKAGLRRFR